MTHCAHDYESDPCAWHMHVRERRVKRLSVDEMNGFSNVTGCANVKLADFQYCFCFLAHCRIVVRQENSGLACPFVFLVDSADFQSNIFTLKES